MPTTGTPLTRAEADAFVDKLQEFHAGLDEREQAALVALLAEALADEDGEVEGYASSFWFSVSVAAQDAVLKNERDYIEKQDRLLKGLNEHNPT